MFYEQVLKLCQSRGISVTKLTEILELSRSTANGWKNGSVPQPKTLKKIADYFEVSTTFLLEGDHGINVAANVTNSSVVQGNRATTLIVKNGHTEEKNLSDQAFELITIFESLDVRRQTALLSRAFELDEEAKRTKK